jgi:superfamily II DNA or RNA helicase
MSINSDFKKYKLPKSTETNKEICLPKKFKHQPQQLFLTDYFNSKYNKNGILVYHKIGAGKTCTAVSIAESIKNKKNIMVLLPASLIGNFRDELRSQCAFNEYISCENRSLLKELSPKSKQYKDIIKDSDKKINKYYKIYSYHKFVDLVNENKIKLKNTLLIVDEIQNMVSEEGIFYKNLKKVIDRSDNKTKILLLSATPMFDKPLEIGLTLNLLKPKNPFNIEEFNKKYLKSINRNGKIEYEIKNKDEFKNHLTRLVSYYRGAPPNAFPKMNFNVVRCNMEDFQYRSYLTSLSVDGDFLKGSFMNADILKLPSNFMLAPRIISNVSFPNKGIGQKGYESFRGKHLSSKNIKMYSKKFYKIYNNIKKSSGPVFVYSNFKDIGGLKSFIKFLEYNGYKNYKKFGDGKHRFAIWSGDESNKVREEIKATFNNSNNSDGSMIKIILGSPSIKEGVSLLRVNQVHIMEPYWNMSRMKQIIGRAIRYCSHKDLKKSNQYVDVYLYLATRTGEKTTDQYIWSMAKRKQKLIEEFEILLKEKAIDCKLFYNRNNYKGEKPIKCSK